MNPSFKHYQFKTGLLGEVDSEKIWALNSGANGEPETLFLDNLNASYYGYVFEGVATIRNAEGFSFDIVQGMYFSGQGPITLTGGKVIVAESENGKAFFHIGGPIEEKGRLKYIDGCHDSLLVAPVKFGMPCLNVLYFPPHTIQTPHTHPSFRFGVVASGSGKCVTPWGNIDLVPGNIFLILKGGDFVLFDGLEAHAGLHSFNTADEQMTVIAFHPDSEFGPQDEHHPMIQKTIVNGVSAEQLPDIQTKD